MISPALSSQPFPTIRVVLSNFLINHTYSQYKLFIPVMLLVPLLNLLSVTTSEENRAEQAGPAKVLIFVSKQSVQEIFPIVGQEDLADYCQSLLNDKLSSHRPQIRQKRASGQFTSFSVRDLDGLLLKNKVDV